MKKIIEMVKSKKRLFIIIGICLLALILVIFGSLPTILSKINFNGNSSALGDVQYSCSEWKVVSYGWKSGAPSSGSSTADPPSTCTSLISYTKVNVSTDVQTCTAATGSPQVPCYEEYVYTRTRTATQCDNGYYLTNGTCYECEAGYYCEDGNTKTSCPVGSTSEIGATSKDDCTPTWTLSLDTYSTTLDIGETFLLGYTLSGIDDEQIDKHDFSYNSSNENVATVKTQTITAVAGGNATITVTITINGVAQTKKCIIYVNSEIPPCSAGYYMGESTCEKCTAGYYCEDGRTRTSCPSGKTSNMGATSEDDCYTIADVSECTVTVSIDSSNVSVDKDNINNSYYPVKVTVSGNGCNGQHLDYSATNASSLSRTSQSDIQSGAVYYFNVYPAQACTSSTATATLRESGKSDSATVSTILTDWETETGCWASSEIGDAPIGFLEADRLGKHEYYDDYGVCPGTTNVYGYTTHGYRFGCGVSNPSVPVEDDACYIKYGNGTDNSYCYGTSSECSGYPDKVEGVISSDGCSEEEACYENTSGDYVTGKFKGQMGYTYVGTSCPVIPEPTYACYVNTTTNDYKWATTSPGSGYTIDVSKTTESSCKAPVVTPTYACYVNSTTGDYKWATTSPGSGYVIDTSKTTESSCKAPVLTPTYSCYVNNTTGDYKWATTSPGSGYVIDSSKTTESSCKAPVVTPTYSCYVNNATGDYKWATTSPGNGYVIDSSKTTESSCKAPIIEETPACYKDKDDKYVWGKYQNNSDYTLIDDILNEDDCKETIDVPITSRDVMNIVYVFVIILLASGIYVIYYSYMKKKNNNNK